MVEVAGGVLLVPSKTRKFGASLAASAIVTSTILIIVSGNLVFGLLSTITIALTWVIFNQSARITRDRSLITDASNAGAG